MNPGLVALLNARALAVAGEYRPRHRAGWTRRPRWSASALIAREGVARLWHTAWTA